MKKLIVTAAILLAVIGAFAIPSYAAENGTETAEAVTHVVTEAAGEIATEENVEATEPATEEETTPVSIDDGYIAEQDRDWLINAIKNAKPEEVEFIKGYIEDALVAMEGLNYTDWEWVYKIVEDNAEWFACMIVGLGFVVAAVVAIVKYRREKLLINNAVGAVGISEREMQNMVSKMDDYETKYDALAQKIGQALDRLDERDKMLAEADEFIRRKEKDNLAASNHDIEAMIMLSDIVGDLVQLSSIPQIKKDSLYTKHATAKEHILKEMETTGNEENGG